MSAFRTLLFGAPLPTDQAHSERLDKLHALAALSPDALASIAYANQEIYLGLVVAGSAGLSFSLPIALSIAGLLAILTLSYTQTITAYPLGGGSYTVARENLGDNFGLVAAAALLTDYILNVAVSVTAGVAALASAVPGLWPYRVTLALILLVVITIANLRGLRDSGMLMSVPVYLFIAAFLLMIGAGLVQAVTGGADPYNPFVAVAEARSQVTLLLVLNTFAAGCTALTGVEAISNGVTVFKQPQIRNANQTMVVMAVLMAVLLLGTIGLTQFLEISPAGSETVLSGLARRIIGNGAGYYLIQVVTLMMLVVAANTSFVGFPRLAAVVAKDGFMPRQLTLLGDRLVFSNGIMLLSGAAGGLVVIFKGDTHLLIPLFAVGAFLAFTLSQMGMVMHWVRQRGRWWWLKAFVNGLGVIATLTALAIITVSKFIHGAWIIVIIIPILVAVFHATRRHYNSVATQLTLTGLPPSLHSLPEPRIVLPISDIHRGVIEALRYARSITDDVTVVYCDIEPGGAERVQKRWEDWGLAHDARLVIVPSPYRSVLAPLLTFLDEEDHRRNDGQRATVLLPEFVPRKLWHMLLHNQTAWLLRLALQYRRRTLRRVRAIIDYPIHLQ